MIRVQPQYMVSIYCYSFFFTNSQVKMIQSEIIKKNRDLHHTFTIKLIYKAKNKKSQGSKLRGIQYTPRPAYRNKIRG